MSLSGLPLASLALLSRSMVPPVMNSTCVPVASVNFFAAVLATRSRQLPPQMLTTSLSCAAAGPADNASSDATSTIKQRFMPDLPILIAAFNMFGRVFANQNRPMRQCNEHEMRPPHSPRERCAPSPLAGEGWGGGCSEH